eukprot:GEMP01008248.1.p1 GENE.GEMP01008248.1~~GEMP01008248.1.p1  ORF type:complete len:805 (+),score=137.85 GEMP01008248.1:41-2455(+)
MTFLWIWVSVAVVALAQDDIVTDANSSAEIREFESKRRAFRRPRAESEVRDANGEVNHGALVEGGGEHEPQHLEETMGEQEPEHPEKTMGEQEREHPEKTMGEHEPEHPEKTKGRHEPQHEIPITTSENEDGHWSYLRWGYWLIIIYMFYAQASVCDHYFVESIKIIVDRYNIPEDVAGATLMALGCNGPELATNFIALFITHSSVGVGTVVGSEIFNLLVIIAGCALVSPVPMEINVIPFYRDSFFYALSIVLLMWVLADGEVSTGEACMLLGCGVVFAVTVASTRLILETLGIDKSSDLTVVVEIPIEESHPTTMNPDEMKQVGVMQRRLSCADNRSSTFFSKSELHSLLQAGEVEVTVLRHNRMQDSHAGGASHSAVHSVTFEENGIHVDMSMFDFYQNEPGLAFLRGAQHANITLGIRPMSTKESLSYVKVTLTPSITPHSQSHATSLVGSRERSLPNTPRQPVGVARPAPVLNPHPARTWKAPPSKPATMGAVVPMLSPPDLKEPLLDSSAPSEHPIAYSECSGSEIYEPEKAEPALKYSDVLRAHDFGPLDLQLDVRGDWNEVLAIQLHAESEDMITQYISMLRFNNVKIVSKETTADAVVEIMEDIVEGNVSIHWKVFGIVTFPIRFTLALTMSWCDPCNVLKQDRWFGCFCMSMFWLAVFSYLMCWTSDQIHVAFGISQTTLGVTLCAIGTSFPNFWASILMAKDGRSSMAVSNALGSNVQNVFLALAIPWIFRTMIPNVHSIPMNAAGIFSGVLWMGGTLVLVLLLVAIGSNRIFKVGGGILILTYVVYLATVLL